MSDQANTELRPKPVLGLGARLLGNEEEELVMEVLRSKRLFRYAYDLPAAEQGAMVGTLEREFRELMGVKHALAVTSGTAALEVALGALGVGPGDEVIVPAWSWVSCFTAVVRLGGRPVLAEVDESLCLAPGEITRLATDKTKAAIVVHYQGAAADMDPILAEAKGKGILILEDCAESPGAIYKGRRVGSIGDIGIFSFQFQKTITSGEGGMVTTNSSDLYERAVRMHDIGLVRPYHLQFIEPKEKQFCGSQFRMNELTGAVALAQFRKLDQIRNHCRKLRDIVLETIRGLDRLKLRKIADWDGESAFEIYFYTETPELKAQFNKRLVESNIHCAMMTGTYPHYAKDYCIEGLAHSPSASPFAGMEMPAAGYLPSDFPRTEWMINHLVALPLGVLFTEEDAHYIARKVKEIYHELHG